MGQKRLKNAFARSKMKKILVFSLSLTLLNQVVEEFKKDANIEYAEPNYLLHTDLLANNPDFPKLYGLDNTNQTGGTADADIDAPEAWDLQTGRKIHSSPSLTLVPKE